MKFLRIMRLLAAILVLVGASVSVRVPHSGLPSLVVGQRVFAGTFVSDTFTGTDGTPLTGAGAHTGETGATWALHSSTPTGSAEIRSGRMRPTGSDTGLFYASGTPGSPDYDVEASLTYTGAVANGVIGVAARIDTSADTCYIARYNTHDFGGFNPRQWVIYKHSSGTETILGTAYSMTLTVGQTYSIKFSLRGSNLDLYVDNVDVISTTDPSSPITAAGKVGVQINGNGSTTTTGLQFESFSAKDPAVATTYTLTGPSTGTVGFASSSFTVDPDGEFSGTITPSDGGDGGTFSPSSLTWSGTDESKTFTYTAASTGAKTISTTDSGSLTDPSPLTYTASNPTGLYRIVGDGNSLTADNFATIGTVGWMEQLQTNLAGTWTYTNKGVNSQKTTDMIADAATDIDPLYSADNAANILVVWEVTNHLKLSPGATATEAYDALVSYCQARKAVGWKVIVITVLPRENDSTFNTKRESVNAWIRENWRSFADAIVDPGSDTRIGEFGDEANTSNYFDTIHLTTAGQRMIAEGVQTAVLNIISGGAVPPSGGTILRKPSRPLPRQRAQVVPDQNWQIARRVAEVTVR